jgi:hypothetical protein
VRFPVSHKAMISLLPWTAGAGLASGHMMLTTQCTLPLLGVCSGCAGCLVTLASLVSWGAIQAERTRSTDQETNPDQSQASGHD